MDALGELWQLLGEAELGLAQRAVTSWSQGSPCGHVPSSLPSTVCPSSGAAECTKGRESGGQGKLEQGVQAAPCPCSHALVIAWLCSSSGTHSHSQKLLESCWSCVKVCSGHGSQDERVAPDSCHRYCRCGTENHLLFLQAGQTFRKKHFAFCHLCRDPFYVLFLLGHASFPACFGK